MDFAPDYLDSYLTIDLQLTVVDVNLWFESSHNG